MNKNYSDVLFLYLVLEEDGTCLELLCCFQVNAFHMHRAGALLSSIFFFFFFFSRVKDPPPLWREGWVAPVQQNAYHTELICSLVLGCALTQWCLEEGCRSKKPYGSTASVARNLSRIVMGSEQGPVHSKSRNKRLSDGKEGKRMAKTSLFC